MPLSSEQLDAARRAYSEDGVCFVRGVFDRKRCLGATFW